jgi:general secretion pathway protein M
MSERLESLRAQWEALTEREKRLVRALGGVAVALVVLLPVYMLSSAIGDLETQNEQVASVLAEIDRADARLSQREAERARAEARYTQRAPELGTFLEGRSSARQMQIASVTNQPEAQEGRFRKRHVRASFPNTSLRKAVRLMVDIESAPYPIAIERIHMEHYQEGDHFNLELGVITYDRAAPERDAGAGGGAAGAGAGGTAQPAAAGGAGGGRAGPPPPP